MNAAKKPTDPLQKAVESAEADFWTIRPPADVRRLVAAAIKDCGRDKAFWVFECLRAGLAAKYGGKKTEAPTILRAPQ